MKQSIRHMVIFCLKHEPDSPEATKFLEDGESILTQIPGVEAFIRFNQISPKNDYEYGFSMDFDDMESLKFYMEHPLHVDFVNQRWLTEVTRFLEIDFPI